MDSYSINFDDSTGVFHLTSRYRSLSLKELLELRDPVSPSTSMYIAEFSKGKISAVPRQEKTTACQQSRLDRLHPGLYSRDDFADEFDIVEQCLSNFPGIDPSIPKTEPTVQPFIQESIPDKQDLDHGTIQLSPVKNDSPSLLETDSSILELGPVMYEEKTDCFGCPLAAFRYDEFLSDWLVTILDKIVVSDIETQAEDPIGVNVDMQGNDDPVLDPGDSVQASSSSTPVSSTDNHNEYISSLSSSLLSPVSDGDSPYVQKTLLTHCNSQDDLSVKSKTKAAVAHCFDDFMTKDQRNCLTVPNVDFSQVRYRTPNPPSPHGILCIGKDVIICEVDSKPVVGQVVPTKSSNPTHSNQQIQEHLPPNTNACQQVDDREKPGDAEKAAFDPAALNPSFLCNGAIVKGMPSFAINTKDHPRRLNALNLALHESNDKPELLLSYLDLAPLATRKEHMSTISDEQPLASSGEADVQILIDKSSGELYLQPTAAAALEQLSVDEFPRSSSLVEVDKTVITEAVPRFEAQSEALKDGVLTEVDAQNTEDEPVVNEVDEYDQEDDFTIKGLVALCQSVQTRVPSPDSPRQSCFRELDIDGVSGDDEYLDSPSSAPKVCLPGLFSPRYLNPLDMSEAVPVTQTVPTLETAIARNSLSLCSHMSEETIQMMKEVNSLFYQIWKEGLGERCFTPGQDERKVLALALEQYESNIGSKIRLDLLEIVKDFVAVYAEIWSQGHPKNGMWRENEDEFFVAAFAIKAVEWKQMVADSQVLRQRVRLQPGSMMMGKAPSSSDWYLQRLGGDGQYCKHRRVEATKFDITDSGLEEGPIHHINFNGFPAYQRCYTPAAVSFWAAATTYDKEIFNKPLPFVHHARVITSQAFRWVDPTRYTGDDKYALWEKKGSAMRDAATSDVEVVYQPIGTWLHDEYTEDDTVPGLAPNDLSYEYATKGDYHNFQLPYLFNYSDDEHVMYNVNEAKRSDFVCTRIKYNRTAYKRERMSGLRYELREGPRKKASLIENRLVRRTLPQKLTCFMESVAEETLSDDEDANARDDRDVSDIETGIQGDLDPEREPSNLVESSPEQPRTSDTDRDPLADTNASEAKIEILDEQVPDREHYSFSDSTVGRPQYTAIEDPVDIDVGAMMKEGRNLIAKLRTHYRPSCSHAEDSDDDEPSDEEGDKESFDRDNGITDHNSEWLEHPNSIDHPKSILLSRFSEDHSHTTTPELTDDSSDSDIDFPEEHEQDITNALSSPASNIAKELAATTQDGRYCSPTKMAFSRIDEVHTPVQSPSRAEDLGSWELDDESILASADDTHIPIQSPLDQIATDIMSESRLRSVASALTADQTESLARILSSPATTPTSAQNEDEDSDIRAASGEEHDIQLTGESWDGDDVFGLVAEPETKSGAISKAAEQPAAHQKYSRAKTILE